MDSHRFFHCVGSSHILVINCCWCNSLLRPPSSFLLPPSSLLPPPSSLLSSVLPSFSLTHSLYSLSILLIIIPLLLLLLLLPPFISYQLSLLSSNLHHFSGNFLLSQRCSGVFFFPVSNLFFTPSYLQLLTTIFHFSFWIHCLGPTSFSCPFVSTVHP